MVLSVPFCKQVSRTEITEGSHIYWILFSKHDFINRNWVVIPRGLYVEKFIACVKKQKQIKKRKRK